MIDRVFIQIEGKKLHSELIEFALRNSLEITETNFREIALPLIETDIPLPSAVVEGIIQSAYDRTFGESLLSELMRDDEVSEIMVNGKDNIYIEKNGQIYKSEIHLQSDEELMHIISRIVSKIGRRIDTSCPLVDARLSDGSRVNAIIPPLSLSGPILTIRKFNSRRLSLEDIIKKNSLTEEMADYLQQCIAHKKNLIISGGTGSGKTSLLNICANMIDPDERIITIEDAAEIKLDLPHVISLESRPANTEGQGEIPIRLLIKNALRMRPDRIIVGEIRSGEALDMLQAMNTGHSGSLTTVHANAPLEALYRVETMSLMSDINIPLSAIRNQINSSIDVIIQQSRCADGQRRITEIARVIKNPNSRETYEVQTIFSYDFTSNTYLKKHGTHI